MLRSVARFQREMLRKREEQEQVKLLAKEPKSFEEKGKLYNQGKTLFYRSSSNCGPRPPSSGLQGTACKLLKSATLQLANQRIVFKNNNYCN